jgi:hypothetical protein
MVRLGRSSGSRLEDGEVFSRSILSVQDSLGRSDD